MDMEQLKMVLETLRGISGDAGSAAKWWVALHYSMEALRYVLTAAVAITTCICAFRFFRSASDADRLCRSIASQLGVDGFDTWYGPDRRRLIAAITELSKR